MELNEYEKKHIEYLMNNAHECTLFLKRDKSFPIEKPCTVALYGNGARNTIKGGTGSGDVDSRYFVSFEQGLKDDGFEIVTEKWLNAYDEIRSANYRKYIKETRKESPKYGYMPLIYSMGYFPAEPEYELPLDESESAADIAVYVLSRNSGEGNDRRLIPGDVYLSQTEINDIMYLNSHYEKFMLVLNVGGVIDLSPVIDVGNILYISQLGVVTGALLGKILLGKANPSGKLTTTWAKPDSYSSYSNFGDLNDVKYEEGIYVGYRFFDSAKIPVLFPFGYGLSYSEFIVKYISARIEKSIVKLSASVKNTSDIPGKQVVQLYMSSPSGKLGKAYQDLVAFAKTRELSASEEDAVELSFDMRDFSSYNEEHACYMLEKGEYILRLGCSCTDTEKVASIYVKDTVIVKQCENKMGRPSFSDMVIVSEDSETGSKLTGDELILDTNDIKTTHVIYKKDEYIKPELEELSDEKLMLLTLGHHEKGIAAIVGSSCKHVVGGAGETCLSVPEVTGSITMADGPAGLRLKSVYGVDKKGTYDVSIDPMMEKMLDFLPSIAAPFIKPPKNRHGELHYQYTTAIPIGTAVAQSFNLEFAKSLGRLVSEEMSEFGVDLWLAPALNIHRNICCGRNFEYYSEDPFLSGKIAAAMTKGVQEKSGKGVTIKHFLCNNQELNRNNGNCHISERALREIYLRGFEICITEAEPKAVMTSYNLVNGVHTSESYDLINDILRCELGYTGLVMTDWIASGRTFCRKSKYPAPYASNNILAGNDLTMSGSPADEKDIRKALKSGKLKREDLIISASRVVRAIDDFPNKRK